MNCTGNRGTGMKKHKNLKILTEGGIMIALATVLSFVPIAKLPNGGSVTLLSMIPILVFSYRHGFKWGIFVAFANSLIQLLLGLSDLKGISAAAVICSVVFDYLVAYTVLAVSGLFRGKKYGLVTGTVLGIVLRFFCHFITGVVVWRAFAPEGQSAYLYSLLYNGSYMGVELLTHTVAAVLLSTTALKKYLK